MSDHFSDTSDLSPEDQEIVSRLRADFAQDRESGPTGQRGLSKDKQNFPIGIKDDGSVNVADADEQ